MSGALSTTTPVSVAGGGSWGTALAHLLAARGLPVTLWLRDADVARSVNEDHENPRYLPAARRIARALYFDYSIQDDFYPQFNANTQALWPLLDKML